MKAQLLTMLIQALMAVLTPELIKGLMDKVLDFIEEKVIGSASTVDDALVLPLCDTIRAAFNIPDED